MKLFNFLLYFFSISAISLGGIFSYNFFLNSDDEVTILKLDKDQESVILKIDEKQEQNIIEDKQSLEENNVLVSILPKVNMIRVEPSGNFVIAGTANPNSYIIVLNKNREIYKGKVDQYGDWAFVSEKPLKVGNNLLKIEQKNNNGTFVLSKEVFVTSINKDLKTKPLVIVLPSEDGGKLGIIQKPQINNESNSINVSNKLSNEFINKKIEINNNSKLIISGIYFDEYGYVTINGSALSGNNIKIKVDQISTMDVLIDINNIWTYTSKNILSFGQHMLNVKLVNKNGKIIDEQYLPFLRVKIPEGLLPDDYVIIKPGDMLWTISYRIYGNPWKYVEIYDENKDQITNPDLIFPGQIFTLPQDKN